MHEKLWRLVRMEKEGQKDRGEIAERRLMERHFECSQESIKRRVGPIGGRCQASPVLGSLEDERNSGQSKRIDRLGRNSDQDAIIPKDAKKERTSGKMAARKGPSV